MSIRKPLTDAQKAAQKVRQDAWRAANKERVAELRRANEKRRYAELKAEGGEKYLSLLGKKAKQGRDRTAAMTEQEAAAFKKKESERWLRRKSDPEELQKILENKRGYVVRARQENPEQYEKIKQHNRNWWANNKAHGLALVRRRQTRLLSASPVWADHEKIKGIYRVAARISEVTGIPHHVDHVIPLRGKLVSGLHVPENLMVVSYDYNCSKNNRYEV